MLIGLSELLFQRRVTRLPDAISSFQCCGVGATLFRVVLLFVAVAVWLPVSGE